MKALGHGQQSLAFLYKGAWSRPTNTYQLPSRLFVAGGKEILSREGPTQGDNLAGTFYAPAQEASEISSNGGIPLLLKV